MNIKEIEEKLKGLKEKLNKEIVKLEEDAKKIQKENQSEDKKESLKELEKDSNDLKVEYLGKKSELQELLKEMKNLSNEEKPKAGKIINEYKQEFNQLIYAFLNKVFNLKLNIKLQEESIDITEPVELKIGSTHPIRKIIEEQIKIFTSMGYSVEDGPEIETTKYVFDMLNTPKNHPARDIQDTFYISDDVVLRSHTSSVQVRTMLSKKPPIKIICPGTVYRSDTVDATHSPVFHQLEGLVIDEGITMSDLKGTLEMFVKRLLGKDTKVRFRPHHFSYTEPSAEVDVSCFVCSGKGCSVCKGEGWIELLGCGMVHPKVLEDSGIDSEKYSGFAFGLGIERVAMAKYGITDMRLLYENDVRFLKQFK